MRATITAPALLFASLLAGCTSGGEGGGGSASRTFWAWDLSVMPPVDMQVEATRRATTEHAYVYVEDALWEAGEVDAAQIETLVAALEDATPAGSVDPAAGIVENDIATFGAVPDALDGDPRFYLLLMNIEGFQSFEFDGFFRALDQYPDGDDPDYRSNEVEILYVNAEIRPVSSETTQAVIAHELVHLLEWGRDPVEDGWLSETFGELGMTVNGYYTDDEWVEDFQANPDEPLFGGEFSVHYGACLLFGNHLYERFGADLVRDLVAETANGAASIDAVLAAHGTGETFETVFLDWVAANALGDYDFAEIPPVALVATVTATNGGAVTTPLVEESATRYVKIDVPGTTTVNVSHGASTPFGARIVVARYSSADPANVFDVAVHDGNTATIPVTFDATYDEAYVGLVAFSAPQTFSVTVTD